MVYLICFDQAFKHARHYVGVTGDLAARMLDHRRGRGARLLEVIAGAGIGWQLVAVRKGGRADERSFKRRKNTAASCPRCRAAHLERRRLRHSLRREAAR